MKPNAKLTEAQRAVLDLANGTLTVLQISEHLGRNFRSVRNDIIALRSKGYDPQLGARPLRRSIQQMVEDPLSEKLLWKEFRVGETIIVDVENGEVVFRAIEGIELVFDPEKFEDVAVESRLLKMRYEG